MGAIVIRADNYEVFRVKTQHPDRISLTDSQISQVGKLTEAVIAKVYPAPLLFSGDAQKRSQQSQTLLYSIIFFLKAQGFISAKDPFIQDPVNKPFEVLGNGFSALFEVTKALYDTCGVAEAKGMEGALDLLPYDSAYEYWLALITEATISEFRNYRSSRGKVATAKTVKETKEKLEKIFPNKKRKKRMEQSGELAKPIENPFNPIEEPIGHKWLEIVIHVGTYSGPSENWYLRAHKKKIRDSFNKWVSFMEEWQKILENPKCDFKFVYSTGLDIEEVKPRKGGRPKNPLPKLPLISEENTR